MPKALLLENIHPDAAKSLRDHGFEVETMKGALSEDELIDALDGVDLVGVRSKTNVTARVLDARPTLSAIGCFCIGTNQVDLAHAGKRGIAVFNAPYSNTRSVVELVICDIICLMRRIPAHTHHIKHGLWDKSASGSHEVRGKTLGIIGYGNIGSQLSVLAEALGMRVVFFGIEEKLALGNAHRCDTLNELLEQSDAVTLHVDGRKSNTGFFGEDQFAHMKQDAIFINLSRGFVADLGAIPVSLTQHSTHTPSEVILAPMTICPCVVNFLAFPIKFINTFVNFTSSVMTNNFSRGPSFTNSTPCAIFKRPISNIE